MVFEFHPKPMKDDPFELLVFMGMNRRKYVITIKRIGCVFMLYLYILYIVSILDTLYNNDWKTFLHYVPFLSIQFLASLGLMSMYYYYKRILAIRNVWYESFWCVSSTGNKTKETILRESKWAMIICAAICMDIIVTDIVFLPFVGDEEGIDITTAFFRKFPGKWSTELIVVHNVILLVSSISVCSVPVIATYTGYHLKFQFYLLTRYVEQTLTEPMNGSQHSDVIYQKRIYTCLVVCANQFAKLKRLSAIITYNADVPILIWSIAGVGCFVFSIYFIIADISPPSNFRIIFFLSSWIMVLAIMSIYGQMLIDQSNLFHAALMNVAWIYWNRKNKQIYQLLLIFTAKPTYVKCFPMTELNRRYFLMVVRAVYSFTALCMKLKTMEN